MLNWLEKTEAYKMTKEAQYIKQLYAVMRIERTMEQFSGRHFRIKPMPFDSKIHYRGRINFDLFDTLTSQPKEGQRND